MGSIPVAPATHEVYIPNLDMKIQRIKYANHPIMGDLSLSFTDESEKPYATIVFAGENGTGKTTILRTIASICTKLEPHCEIECVLDESDKAKLAELGFTLAIRNDMITLKTEESRVGVAIVEYQLDTSTSKTRNSLV